MKKTAGERAAEAAKLAKKSANEASKLSKANQLVPRAPKSKTSAKRAQKAVGKALRQPGRGGPFGTPTAQALGRNPLAVHATALAWADSLERPFNGSPQKCPFNFNPVPSYLSMVATTTTFRTGIDSVGPGTTQQLTIMPGHGPIASGNPIDYGAANQFSVADMDEVAYHYYFQKVGATPVAWGPCNFTDPLGINRACMSYVVEQIPMGTAKNDSNTATSIAWTSGVPFSGDTRSDGHLRAKLTSLGLRIINTSPEISRGGSIVTVQPAIACDIFLAQSANAVHPSFHDWGSDSAEVTWVPRMRDLSYWHPSAGTTINPSTGVGTGPIMQGSLLGPAIVAWVNNPTAAAMTYDVELVAHWEISGIFTQSLQSQGKSTLMSDNALKGALAAQINNAPTAKGFVETLKSAAGVVGQAKAAVEKVAGVAGAVVPRVAAAGALLA